MIDELGIYEVHPEYLSRSDLGQNIDEEKMQKLREELINDEYKFFKESGFGRQRNQMTAAMTFKDLLVNMDSLFQKYRELPKQSQKLQKKGFFKKLMSPLERLLGEDDPIADKIQQEMDITSTEFLFKVIEIITSKLKKDKLVDNKTDPGSDRNKRRRAGADEEPKRISELEQWEKTASRKVEEMMKINSFTNEKKHTRMVFVMTRMNDDSNNLDNESIKKSEVAKFEEAVKSMDVLGMPLSLNEKIMMLQSRVDYWEGILADMEFRDKE